VEVLVEVITRLWEMKVPFILLGGGSNVLISDKGAGVVVHSRARQIRFDRSRSTDGMLHQARILESSLVSAVRLAGLEWAEILEQWWGGDR
jgi:UDP-N-acetylenolpyruvoylglucosamine reductase